MDDFKHPAAQFALDAHMETTTVAALKLGLIKDRASGCSQQKKTHSNLGKTAHITIPFTITSIHLGTPRPEQISSNSAMEAPVGKRSLVSVFHRPKRLPRRIVENAKPQVRE